MRARLGLLVAALLIPLASRAQDGMVQKMNYDKATLEGLSRFVEDIPRELPDVDQKERLLIVVGNMPQPEVDVVCRQRNLPWPCRGFGVTNFRGYHLWVVLTGPSEWLAIVEQEIAPRVGKYVDWHAVFSIGEIKLHRGETALLRSHRDVVVEGRYHFNFDGTVLPVDYQKELYKNFRRKS